MTVQYKKVDYSSDIKEIGVVSDTHIPTRGRVMPNYLFDLFDKVDLILHAGDLVDEQVLEELKALAPVEAVAGNMDPVMLQSRLGRLKLLKVGQVKIGLLHGDIGGPKVDYEQVLELFRPHRPQAVVFGHLHQPVEEIYEKTLFFNPGSLIDPRRGSSPTCGLLHLDNASVRSEIVYLD
ncbi:MAG: YfcE family phosphodiesterase [Bacillota bacterium]